MQNWQRAGFGLYVHWPFCQAKCPYCDFNSHVVANIDQSAWAAALVAEIERQAATLPNRVLSSIFFGGGTPSLMSVGTVADIIEAATRVWTPSNQIEITLEANPTSIEAAKFAALRDVGVNRVSIGVQSLRPDDLKALGRLHTVDEAKAAVETARSVFDRVSFDLIYARQHQSLDDWKTELNEALGMGVDHLSLYQLTIEPGTAFGARHAAGGLKGLPDDDLGADMFEATGSICADHGLPAYEVSNHCKPGAESRHNLIYWNSGDWVGVGPGAHGRFTTDDGRRLATIAHAAPGKWLSSVRQHQTGQASSDLLSEEEHAMDAIFMGLRLAEGLSADNPGYDRLIKSNKFNDLLESGLLQCDAAGVRLTESGRPLLNAVVRELLD